MNIEKYCQPTDEDRPGRKFLVEVHLNMIDQAVVPTCVTCCYWNNSSEACSKYNARPPARTIVTGCQEWYFDDIPF